jgi:hypothetical protein
MGISVFPVPSNTVASGSQTFTSSSTWTAPAGVTAVTCTVVGGGGGGGASGNSTTNSNFNYPAGGGAGGAVSTSTVPVTPGTTYTVVVGAGGAKGVSTGPDTSFVSASAGGYSSFGLNYTVQNAILNGAVELGNGDWLQGEQSNADIDNPPSYPSGYNGEPTVATNTNTSNRNSITNVTGVLEAGLTRWFTNSRGNSSYRDLILWVPVTGNTQYILSAYGGSTNNAMSGKIRIDWYSGFNSGLLGNMAGATVTLPSTNSPGWVRTSVTGTSPSNATWALVRLMSSATSPIWTGVLLQTGSTQNNYVGPLTSLSNKTIPGLGIISVTSGVVNNGGGGGVGLRTSTAVEAPGFGGGQGLTQGGNFVMGGNGAGAGTPGTFNIIASQNAIPYINSYSTINNGGGGIPAGNAAVSLNSTNGGYIVQPNGNTGLNGYGAGGMGARATFVVPGVPGPGVGASAGTGNVGANATINTGAGGGGGIYSTTNFVGGRNGGDGGSGIVTLSW